MYIRQVRRQNKDGSSVTYVQLAHNERDPQTGTPKAHVLYSFGRADALDLDALKRLVASISRFLSPEDALRIRAEADGPQLRFLSSRPLGGGWLDTLQRMHLGEFIAGESRVLQRSETTREQASIFDAMGISAPPRFIEITPPQAETA